MRFALAQLIQLRREWVPYVILIVSLAVTIGVVFYYIAATENSNRLRFKNAAQRTRTSIVDHFNTYIALLRGGAGLFAAQETVTREEFKAFVDRMQLQSNYPAVQGIGYAKSTSQDNLPLVIEQMRYESDTDFTVWPENNRSEHVVVLYLEPKDDRNKRSIGYDMSTEAFRRTAMERARDTGTPILSGTVALVQGSETDKQLGFLLYLPVYEKEAKPTTSVERRKYLEGFIYSPFIVKNAFQGMLQNLKEPNIAFTIYDGKGLTDKNLIYDSATGAKTNPESYTSKYTKNEQINLAGRTWTLIYKTTPEFDKGSGPNFAPFLLVAGFLGSLFLFYISRLQYKARIKAERSEQKLRLSEERYKRLVASTKVVPWEADAATGNFTYIGAQAKQLLGFPINDWYKEGFWQSRIHPDDKVRAIKDRQSAIQTKQEFELHYRMLKKNRKVVWIHDIVTVVHKTKGKKLITGILIDVTEREMIAKQKDDFVSIATHELKTPVTSIKAFTQVLLKQFEKANDKQSAEYIAIMEAQLNKLINLIGDLLDVTRLESGSLRYREDLFDSNKLIQEIVDEVQRTTLTHTIRTSLDESQVLYGDRDRIGQVLTNFLTNAIKYSPSNKTILVTSKKGKKQFTCYVKDFGVGIPAESRKKVFERFFRVTRPHEDTIAGLGLGLYLSAEIIKRHNGKLGVESIYGKGSTFYFTLPVPEKKK